MRNWSEPETRILQLRSPQCVVICLVSTLGLVLRLLPLLQAQIRFAFYLKDSPQYIQLDNGLVKGCGFARLIDGVCQSAELLRTPLYPAFLAALPNIRTALAVQSLIGSLICLALGLLVLRLWSYKAAVVSTSLLAFDIPSIVAANQIITEQLFTLLLLVAVLPSLLLISGLAKVAWAQWIALVCGVAAAAAILTRPIGAVLVLIVGLPFLEIRSLPLRRRLRLAAIAVVIPAVVMGGWSLRNYRLGGYLGLSTVSAINLYYYRAPGVLARARNITFDDAQEELGHQIGIPFENIFEVRYQSSALSHEMNVRAKKIFLTYPKQTILMTAEGIAYNALSPMRSELANWLQLGPRESGVNANGLSLAALEEVLQKILKSPLIALLVIVQMAANLLLWIGVGLAFVHCLKGSAEYRTWCLYLGLVGCLFLALAAGAEANARFRVPPLPLLSVVAGLGYGFRGVSREVEERCP